MSSIDYCNLDLSKTPVVKILETIVRELTTTSIHNYFIEVGRMIHHLKTIRCAQPIHDDNVYIIYAPRTQFNLAMIEICNIHTQYYPKGRITDVTDLSPTHPTYVADIVLYTKRPFILYPKSLLR